jgi:hypothetical protein
VVRDPVVETQDVGRIRRRCLRIKPVAFYVESVSCRVRVRISSHLSVGLPRAY